MIVNPVFSTSSQGLNSIFKKKTKNQKTEQERCKVLRCTPVVPKLHTVLKGAKNLDMRRCDGSTRPAISFECML